MRNLLALIVVVGLLTGAYFYFVPGAPQLTVANLAPQEPKVDEATGKPSTKEIPDAQAAAVQSTPQPATRTAEPASPGSTAPPPMETIKLTNGKIIRGKVVIRDEAIITVRTEDGKSLQIPTSDLLKPKSQP